jgi:carboxylate-amine ligase
VVWPGGSDIVLGPMDSTTVSPYEALVQARERFEGSQDLTVAIEEEFQILDPVSLDLTSGYERLSERAAQGPLREHLAGELIASEIEVKTGRCETFTDAARFLPERRRALFEAADALGYELCATGTHPWSPWQDQRIIDTPHYRLVEEHLRYLAWRNNTWGMHLHVGVHGADRAVRLANALRAILPDLLALSCSSPWSEGRLSGLASTRSQLFTRAFPRCGIPEPLADWAEYDRYVRFLLDTRSIIEHTQIWWCVRPHQDFGTVEVRNADGFPDARESVAVAAFAYAMAARALRAIDDGEPLVDHPPRVLEENQWRAIRYGMSGELIDLATMRAVPAAERVRALLDDAAPEVLAHGLGPLLAPLERIFTQGTCAARIVRAVEGGSSLEEAFAAEVRSTRESARPEAESTEEAGAFGRA